MLQLYCSGQTSNFPALPKLWPSFLKNPHLFEEMHLLEHSWTYMTEAFNSASCLSRQSCTVGHNCSLLQIYLKHTWSFFSHILRALGHSKPRTWLLLAGGCSDQKSSSAQCLRSGQVLPVIAQISSSNGTGKKAKVCC